MERGLQDHCAVSHEQIWTETVPQQGQRSWSEQCVEGPLNYKGQTYNINIYTYNRKPFSVAMLEHQKAIEPGQVVSSLTVR